MYRADAVVYTSFEKDLMEELFDSYLGISKYPRGDFEISRWKIKNPHVGEKKFFGGIK